MDKYKNYTQRNFVQDDDFIRWVKYPDLHSDLFWNEVRKTYPHQNARIDNAIKIVKILVGFHPEVSETEIHRAHHEISKKISNPKNNNSFISFRFLSIAASILLMIGISVFYDWQSKQVSNSTHTVAVEKFNGKFIENSGRTHMSITLPDSSMISLAPGSHIYYSYIENNKREVRLVGEATFRVTKNNESPFFVFSEGLIMRVLGTSFKVSAFKNVSEVKVEVNSGRVQVYPIHQSKGKATSGLILTPNQRAVFKKEDASLIRSLISDPRPVIPEEQHMPHTYTHTPLYEIFSSLEETYGIKVIYDVDKFKDCRVNLSFSDETLFEKLELIGKVVEARYNVVDGQVMIIGEGCR